MSSALEYFVNYDKIPLSKRIAMSNVKDQTHRNMNKDEEFELQGRHINWRTGINTPDPDSGLTPLMLASLHGKRDLVIALLERGAEVEFPDSHRGRTALHFACKAGNADVVNELLKRGALVNAKDNANKTPLVIASKGGFSEVVRHLLPRGAGVNSTDERGLSSLHYAAKFGHFEVLDVLINHRGAIELRDNVEGFSPIHYAAQYGRKECVRCLLDYGGKVNRRTTKEKLTPLMLAAREGNKSIVSLLVSRGADVALYDIYGWTALHFASSWGRKDTAQIIIVDGKADVNQRCPRKDNDMTGTPPLCIAAKGSQVELVKLLLHYGADINLSDILTGHAALAYSAGAGMTFSVQILIEYGADINRRSEVTGRTALMEAVDHGRHSCITKLLDAFADLNILDYRMASCWEVAIEASHQEILLGSLLQSSRRSKVNALPWLQMHFHQLTDYHRWDEYHVHDEYDLLYDRMFGIPDDETQTVDMDDEEEEEEAQKGYDEGQEGGTKAEQYKKELLFEKQRQVEKKKQQQRLKRKQQVKYIKRAFATAGQYLKAYLFGREGCFSGLFSLPGDCDVYLVYNLMMILSTCVQPNHVPEDIVIFQDILSKVGNMLVSIFQSDQTQLLPTMIDMMIMGKEPVDRILPELLAATSYHNATRLLSSSFVYGPWAMFLEAFAHDFETLFYHVSYQYGQPKAKYTHPSHGLFRSPVSNILLQPRIKQMVHNVFHTWDKEHGLIVDGYGYYTEKVLYLRYTPAAMYYLEGLGRALLVICIIIYTQQMKPFYGSYASYLYPPTNHAAKVVEAGISNLLTIEMALAATVLSHIVYEIGLIEEKRWSISPAMVFAHDTLEKHRWKMVYYHFCDDPYKILDGLSIVLATIWMGCRLIVFLPNGFIPQNTALNLLSAGTQALTLCLIPQTLGLARYLGTLFPEFGKVCIGIAFLMYDLWPFLFVYMLVGLAVGSAVAGILTLTPLGAFQYLLSFLFFRANSFTSSSSGSSNDALESYINRASDSAEVNPVYTSIMIVMIVFCFPTAGIIFLSIIQRLFSRQQSSGANSGSNSNGSSGTSNVGTNPVEYNGYNMGVGSSPEDVIEKYYYYWHCRRIQEHSLVLEKSALCMLPPPLNLLSLLYYIPHVYLGWRARLRFDLDITISFGGIVTDTILFLLLLLPCAIYEYCLKNIYGIHRIVTQNYETDRADMSPESNFGRMMGLLYLPFGVLYTMYCLLYKYTHDTAARMIIKTRLQDGRVRMSKGILRDIYEANILARLEDYRIHGHLRFYASTHPQMNREYEYNAFEQKAIAVANLKRKPTSAAAAAAYAAIGGVVNTQKPFSTALNVPKYTEEIYSHEFSEFQSSKASIQKRDEEDDDDNDDYTSKSKNSVQFQQSTKYKERGGRYLTYDEDDRKLLQDIEDGYLEDSVTLVGTEHPRIPRSVSIWQGVESGTGVEEFSLLSSWLPFKRRFRPSDYVGKKIKIVPHRPFLQLRLLQTQIPETHPANTQPLPDNPNISVPQHLSLDNVLQKMAKDLRLRKWKAHQEMLLRTKQVASRQNLFVNGLDTASMDVTDGLMFLDEQGNPTSRNPLEEKYGEEEQEYMFDGQKRGEKLMDSKEAKHPDHFKRPRLIFQTLLQSFRQQKQSNKTSSLVQQAEEEETGLDALATRDVSLYQPGIETERQWALLAYEHDLVTTHHVYSSASQRSHWQKQRQQRAQQPVQSRFGAYGSSHQSSVDDHANKNSNNNSKRGKPQAWLGKELSEVYSQKSTNRGKGRSRYSAREELEDAEHDDHWLQMQSTYSLSPTLLEEQMHLNFQPTSLYYQPFQHPPIFSAKEREQIFRHALPDYFPSDFARAMLDVDLNVTLLQEMLPWLLEKQVQTLDQRLQRRFQHQQHQQFQQMQQMSQQLSQQQQDNFLQANMTNSMDYLGGGGGGGMGMMGGSYSVAPTTAMTMSTSPRQDKDNRILQNSFMSNSFIHTPTRARSPNTMNLNNGEDEHYGQHVLRPAGEEDHSASMYNILNSNGNNVNNQSQSRVLPGGQIYGDDDDDDYNNNNNNNHSALKSAPQQQPAPKRSVSFLHAPTMDDAKHNHVKNNDASLMVMAMEGDEAKMLPPSNVHPANNNQTNAVASGGGRIQHEKVVNYMVASGKDPTRYSGNGSVWY